MRTLGLGGDALVRIALHARKCLAGAVRRVLERNARFLEHPLLEITAPRGTGGDARAEGQEPRTEYAEPRREPKRVKRSAERNRHELLNPESWDERPPPREPAGAEPAVRVPFQTELVARFAEAGAPVEFFS